jgi:ABC-2 type transport system permease protein
MQSLVRIQAFVRKEIVDVVRQPLLLMALIIGPFLILLAFGAGLRETDPPLRTALVASEESDVREDVEDFANDERDRGRLVIEELTSDELGARSRLRNRELDLVIVFPDEVAETVQEDEQAVIHLYHNKIDPIEGQAIALFSRTAVDEINNRLLETVVEDLQIAVRDSEDAREARSALEDQDEEQEEAAERADELLDLSPTVVVSPFRGETSMIAGSPVDLTDFYAPAVVVVLLQHLAVTLLGLSVVRERALGATHMFRVSPLRTWEYLAGKYAGFVLLGGVVGGALLALLIFGLGTPMVGEWWHLAVALLVLLLASTALGLVLSLLANTDSQAVQYAMLVLLATIFLSGFLLSLERFLPFAQPIAWLLPATYAIQLVRDTMLRGAPLDLTLLGGLAAYGIVFALLGAKLAYGELRRPGM